MNPTDTIVAISTPAGVGGIAVIRLSGPHALPIATRHLTPIILNSQFSILNSHHATYCYFSSSPSNPSSSPKIGEGDRREAVVEECVHTDGGVCNTPQINTLLSQAASA